MSTEVSQQDRAAVRFDRDTVTAGRLASAERAVASALADAGLGPGNTVAVLMGTSPAHVAVLLGAVRAGCTVAAVSLPDDLPQLSPDAVLFDSDQTPRLRRTAQIMHGVRWLAVNPTPSQRTPWARPLRPFREDGKPCPEPNPALLRHARLLHRTGHPELAAATPLTLADSLAQVQHRLVGEAQPPRVLACDAWPGEPLAQAAILHTLLDGGTVALVPRLSEPDAVWRQTVTLGADTVVVRHARTVRALEYSPADTELLSVRHVWSTAPTWSGPTTSRLADRLPRAELVECVVDGAGRVLATRRTSGAQQPAPGRFRLAESTALTSAGLPGPHRALALYTPLGAAVPSGWHVMPTADEDEVDVLGPAAHRFTVGKETVYLGQITALLREQPGVRDAQVLLAEHHAVGEALAAALVVDDPAGIPGILDAVRRQLPGGCAPRRAVVLSDHDRDLAGFLDTAQARSVIRRAATQSDDVSEDDMPDSPPKDASRPRAQVWRDLAVMAMHDGDSLEEALAWLAARPQVERDIAQALDPDWPVPLNLLTRRRRDLVPPGSELDVYLGISDESSNHVLAALEHYGWPTEEDGPTARWAAWALLQAADGRTSERQAVCDKLAKAVRAGDQDSALHLAWLTDRSRIVAGEPEMYGTRTIYHRRGDSRPYAPKGISDTEARMTMRRCRTTIGLPGKAWESRQILPAPTSWPAQAPHGDPDRLLPSRPRISPELRPEPIPLRTAPVYLTCGPDDVSSSIDAAVLTGMSCAGVHYTSRWYDFGPGSRPAAPIDAGPALERLVHRMSVADMKAARLVVALDDGREPSRRVTADVCAAATRGLPILHVGDPRAVAAYGPQAVSVPTRDHARKVLSEWAGR